MRSSLSALTDSIENESLPSVPIQSGPRQHDSYLKRHETYYKPIHSSTPNTSRLISKFSSHRKSFPSTSLTKQSKTPELNKINEYAVLKVFEQKNFGQNSPSNYSRMSEDMSAPYLPRSKNLEHVYLMPSITSHYCKIDLREETFCRAPKGCIYLPKLQAIEAVFLRLVDENNIDSVKQHLEDHPSLNINCVNFQGISALYIAVRNRSEEMVEFLLKYPCMEIGDIVLHAVKNNCIKILVILLDALRKTSPGLEFAGTTHSTTFPTHVTPLILAAQLNNYEMVNMLISRGHTIFRPHSLNCDCVHCKNCLVNEDGLHTSTARLSVYRAVCSPAYLVHVTSDPILEVFYLTEELTANAAFYRHLAVEYLELREQVKDFAVQLIGNCRTSNEVELILKQTAGCEGRPHFVLPRLVMAMNYKQTEFVAHPNTQQVLESYWMGDWYSWHTKSLLEKVSIFVSRIFMLPLIFLFCVLLPRHWLLKHYQIPLNKLITHAASYFFFLTLIFYISDQDKTKMGRGPPNTGVEWLVVLYVCGYTWSAIRMCLMQGPRRFYRAMWNWAEIIMLILFWLTFIFWGLAAVEVASNPDDDKIERKYWNQYDPILLAEGTFCLATICAFLRVMLLCQLSYHLGPLQVSLGKMTIDIYKYTIVFAIIISAFAAGLARLYQYYNGMVYEDKYGMKTVQMSSFTSLIDTLNTLFWALFCMTPPESADIVLENSRPMRNAQALHENKHGFTERIGYFCFGCFEVISVIVVLNMLIATMSNTFQKVTDNVTTEWTFGKTGVYIEYMWQTTLPSPLNLLPTTSGLASACHWFRAKTCNMPGVHARWSFDNCCFIERDIAVNIQKEYPALMSVLVQRYFGNTNKA